MELRSRRRKTTPVHVGVIPDGNRRWARSLKSRVKNLSWYIGNRDNLLEAAYGRGAERLKDTVLTLFDEGVKHVTFYAFSEKNFGRSEEEIGKFMGVMKEYLVVLDGLANDREVRVNFIGSFEKFPKEIQGLMSRISESTRGYRKNCLNILAGYYGSEEAKSPGYSKFPSGTPKIDLLIRTSGVMRLSGFAPLLVEDAELYFPDVNWPDFNKKHVYKALEEYSKRERRHGR